MVLLHQEVVLMPRRVRREHGSAGRSEGEAEDLFLLRGGLQIERAEGWCVWWVSALEGLSKIECA